MFEPYQFEKCGPLKTMSYINLLRKELSQPPETYFDRLSKLEICRKQNPYALFQFFRLEEESSKYLAGPSLTCEVENARMTSLMDFNRTVKSILNFLPWALDQRLVELLQLSGKLTNATFGSAAYVEIHTSTLLRDLTDKDGLYYEFRTWLRINYP